MIVKTAEVVGDATVTPTVVDRPARTYSGCVYDNAGKVVPISQRSNEAVFWKHIDPEMVPRVRKARNLDGRSVYLGHYSGHYGHFLMETLSRFWILLEDDRFDSHIFQPFVHPVPDLRDFSPAKVCFECFGIDEDRVVFADRPLRARELTVPSSLCALHVGANDEQADVYRRISQWCYERYEGSTVGSDLRLYLSRRKFKGHKPIENEEDVEQMFSSIGFAVIFPEHMPFYDQVNAFSRARVIAGLTGSAMHNSVFMPAGALAIAIGHHRRNNPNATVANQLICDGLAGVRSAFVPFDGEIVDERTNVARMNVERLRASIEAHL